MLPTRVNRVNTSQPFKLLVAHSLNASDPSKGEVGNPVPLRRGFETQLITDPLSRGRLGNITTDRNTQLVIHVTSTEYGNDKVQAVPPFYDQDVIKASALGLNDNPLVRGVTAGDDFGRGEGAGLGNVNDVATTLALALDDSSMGISAEVDPNDPSKVIVTTRGKADDLVLNIITISYGLFNGNPPFVIEDINGNELYNPATNTTAVGTVIQRANGVAPMREL